MSVLLQSNSAALPSSDSTNKRITGIIHQVLEQLGKGLNSVEGSLSGAWKSKRVSAGGTDGQLTKRHVFIPQQYVHMLSRKDNVALCKCRVDDQLEGALTWWSFQEPLHTSKPLNSLLNPQTADASLFLEALL